MSRDVSYISWYCIYMYLLFLCQENLAIWLLVLSARRLSTNMRRKADIASTHNHNAATECAQTQNRSIILTSVFILQSLMEKGINSTSKGSISYFSEQAIFTATTKTSIASSNCSMEINVGANLIFESSGSCMPG